MSPPFLATKFYIPEPRPEMVERPRLLQRLDESLQAGKRVLFLSAPAGYGKSTLLGEWINRQNRKAVTTTSLRFAWLSLDSDDNDPARFWVYIVRAIQNGTPEFGEQILAGLTSPEPAQIEMLLGALINEIAAISHTLLLVIDDLHLIKTKSIHAQLTYLIDNLPSQMRLALLSRSEPPLPLARLRARGQLCELRAGDLRFSLSECENFLNRINHLDISPTDLQALENRTEGWIAGLQLAALSLQGRSDAGAFIRSFTGNSTYIMDYLTEEVLDRQSENIRRFLLQTCLLDRLCADLCNAVTLQEDGQETLETLSKDNLFLIPLDNERNWFRYHHLFAELLQAQLKRTRPDPVPELHRRAGGWFDAHQYASEAIRHTIAGGNIEKATELIKKYGMPALFSGDLITLLKWLEMIPEEALERFSTLRILYAWVYLMTGRIDDAEKHLQAAEQHLTNELSFIDAGAFSGHAAAIRAYAASMRGDITSSLANAKLALAEIPLEELGLRSVVNYTTGITSMLINDFKATETTLAEASTAARISGTYHIAVPAMCTLGTFYIECGRVAAAEQLYQDALLLTSTKTGKPLPLAARSYMAMSDLAYEMNDLDHAETLAQQGIELGKLWGNIECMVKVHQSYGRCRMARGDLEGANEIARQITHIIRQSQAFLWMNRSFNVWQVRLWLMEGKNGLSAANRWAKAWQNPPATRPLWPDDLCYQACARVLLVDRQYERSLQLAGSLYQMNISDGPTRRQAEKLAIKALSYQGLGILDQALDTIEDSLQMTLEAGYQRTFIDFGDDMVALLKTWLSQHPNTLTQPEISAYVERILAGFKYGNPPETSRKRPGEQPGLVEALSEREFEVLRLVDQGLTNTEIARKLVIEVSTVKRHINHILGKLGATHRTQAVAEARKKGLIN